MKKLILSILLVFACFTYANSWDNWAFDNMNVFFRTAHTWTGVQTFPKVYVTDQVDSANINARSGITPPVAANPAPTVQGQFAYSTNLKGFVRGDGTNSVLETSPYFDAIMIPSPDGVDDSTNQPFYCNTSGSTIYISGVTIITDVSGTSVSVKGGVTQFGLNYDNGSASDFWMGATMSTTSGLTVYSVSFASGTSTLAPREWLIYSFGGGSSPGWIVFQFTGRKEGSSSVGGL